MRIVILAALCILALLDVVIVMACIKAGQDPEEKEDKNEY